MFVDLVLNFSNQILVQLLLRLLYLRKQTHYVSFSGVSRSVCTFGFVNNFLGDCLVFVQKLIAHCVKLSSFFPQLFLNQFKTFPTLFQQLRKVQPSVNIGLLQVVERFVSWFESNQSEPIRFIVNRRQLYSSVLQFLPVEVLEANLDKFDGIFSFYLTQIKDDQIQHLLHLHGVLFIFILFGCKCLDYRCETQLDESLYSFKYVGCWSIISISLLLSLSGLIGYSILRCYF